MMQTRRSKVVIGAIEAPRSSFCWGFIQEPEGSCSLRVRAFARIGFATGWLSASYLPKAQPLQRRRPVVGDMGNQAWRRWGAPGLVAWMGL
jgi:hypothetical protein